MPELPEVETMVRGVRRALLGSSLERLEVLDPSLLQNCDGPGLTRRAEGARIDAVERRGKWVVLRLGPSRGIIVIQPRMSGGFWLRTPDRPQHIRLIFRAIAPGQPVWFTDTRRLGKVYWYADDAELAAACGRSHGPDALEIDRESLKAGLAGTGRGIKSALLDQKIVAGIGNIYADEILFRAGLHPERPASGLTAPELRRLHRAIGPILRLAIDREGSSFDGNYRTILGEEGGYLRESLVHFRKGEPCRDCGTPIVKTKIRGLIGRPTYLCPRCQPIGI